MCHTQVLYLDGNQIGDTGMISLAEALGKGALASLERITVDNQSHAQLVAACQPRCIQIG